MSHTTSIRLDKLTQNKKRFERYKNDVHLFKFLNNYFCILYINIFAYQSIFFFQSPEMSKTSSMELETPKQEITSRRKYLIGPIVFLHLFTFSMFNTVINLYYPYQAGKELHVFPNESVTSEESSLCQSNENSSSTNEQIVQSVVAEYFLYASVCMGIPCLISNIFIGSISDRYGR